MLKVLLLCVLVSLMGCRGYNSEKEPIHLNPNLDFQAKYKAQTYSQQPVEGTVPWGNEQSFFKENRSAVLGSDTVPNNNPLTVNPTLMKRGQERFDIYCAVCHDKTGSGQSIVVKRGFVPPPDLVEDRIQAYSDGELYDIISNGIRNMPAYAKQIPENDRWAIVGYVRALQKARSATLDDVPEQLRNKVED